MSWFKKMRGVFKKCSEQEYDRFYHGTDSSLFDEFDPSQAAKEDVHYNPLGSGLYATDKPNFARLFGKNVYETRLPKGCKIKKLLPSCMAVTENTG